MHSRAVTLGLSGFLTVTLLITACAKQENSATTPVPSRQQPVASVTTTPSLSSPTPAVRLAGNQAPDFLITLYQDDAVLGAKTFNLSQLRGKPVVLNFYAGNCPPCRAEMPAIQSTYQSYRDQVLLIGIDVGPFTGLGTREEGKKLLQDLNIDYPAGTTLDSAVPAQYQILAMPSTVSITPDGKILRKITGAVTALQASAVFEELVRASHL